jgi:hypothetical protein
VVGFSRNSWQELVFSYALVCSTFTAKLRKESKYGSLDRQSFETLTKIKYRGDNVKKKKKTNPRLTEQFLNQIEKY